MDCLQCSNKNYHQDDLLYFRLIQFCRQYIIDQLYQIFSFFAYPLKQKDCLPSPFTIKRIIYKEASLSIRQRDFITCSAVTFSHDIISFSAILRASLIDPSACLAISFMASSSYCFPVSVRTKDNLPQIASMDMVRNW